MTTNGKIFLAFGLLGGLAVIITAGAILSIFIFVRPDPAEYVRAEKEGEQFGQNISQTGCLTEGYKRSRNLSTIDIDSSLILKKFVDAYLKRAIKVEGFCEGVPGALSDTGKWGGIECKRAGLEVNNSACVAVAQSKYDYCIKFHASVMKSINARK